MLLNNRYQVIRTLGSGGFGDTFLAEDTQMPSQRRCVIKLLKPIENNPQIYQLVQERFAREAAILEELGSLSSQIPTLYAYFYLSDKFYLVQEWVEGDTLTAKVQQQGLFNESGAKEILSNILPVLEFVHSKRIVHRDIKPDNIILRRSDNKPVLIDFGAVRETMGTAVNSQGSLTRSIIIGTPGYMPSEQAAGRAVYSSDLYSLSLTIVYLLSGKSPQQLETDSHTGEIIWESDVKNISSSFKTVINKAIAFHPRERFSSASEMLQALQNSDAPFPATVTFQPSIITSNISTQNFSPKQNHKSQENQSRKPNGILPQSIVIGGVMGLFAISGLWLLIPKNTTPKPEVQTSIVEPETTTKLKSNITKPVESQLPVEPEPQATIEPQETIKPQATIEPQPIIKPVENDFSWLSSKRVTDADLDSMDGYTLDIMRNSIFARHGRRFDNPGLQEYFDKQSWYISKYSPKQFPSNLASKIELQNVEYISKYQDRTNKRFFRK
ncbi:protein kinase domain-containing protein [Rivularia sp. UHCC 0363]|uniref:protein kinase domain-containing protein n=1 Tax=Rivularia sp. UHCC 0363 TaxID=3110244 RepID=UPI002B1EA3D8|nr:YARHG domain-containing protein [Rivularia sp. UHCC 0363]MEA5596674.1 YARHG domain-containing protein [Rivularia sp. UHCC 0363]